MKAQVNEEVANGVAACMVALQEVSLRHPVSISEAIDWGRMVNGTRTKEAALNAIGLLAKDRRDIITIKDIVAREGGTIWNQAE